MIDQGIILASGALAIWFSQDLREPWRRWSCVAGIIGQPFWFYSTWHSEQWGMFALTCFYTLAFLRGLYGLWLMPWLKARSAVPRQAAD